MHVYQNTNSMTVTCSSIRSLQRNTPIR